jgi:hypothetical protein
MKDGRTHLACKAEHAVDLETEAIVAANVTTAERGDAATGPETLILAQAQMTAAGIKAEVRELVADKGYHDNQLLAECEQWSVRTYIPERRQKTRRWTDKPPELERAFRANRRRVRSEKGKRLNRWRSERCERTFAHVCETGGGRRSWLRGLTNVSKVHVLKCAAYNLGLLLRKIWGLRKPRNWEEGAAALGRMILSLCARTATLAREVLDCPFRPFYRFLHELLSSATPAVISAPRMRPSPEGVFKRAVKLAVFGVLAFCTCFMAWLHESLFTALFFLLTLLRSFRIA